MVKITRSLKRSPRGELEITDLNGVYLSRGDLDVVRLGRGIAWLDAGTFDALLDAGSFIATLERRQGLKVACIEEIAWRNDWIGDDQLERLAARHGSSDYGRYLRDLLVVR